MNVKENVKRNFTQFKNTAAVEIINLRTGNVKLGKGDKALIAGSTALGAMLYGGSAAFAATSRGGTNGTTSNVTIFSNATTMLGTYYTHFAGLTTALAILLGLIGFLWAMLSPSGRGSEKAFGWIKRVALCWLVINCLGGILAIGENLTANEHYTVTTP